MLGIEDRVHFGQGVNGYREPDDGGVLLTLADGATRRTDALVGADGVNSAIRRLRLPHAAPADTGSACIYGKTPLDAALDSRLTSATSVIFGPDYAIVVDPMRFRFPTQAGALTPVADYLYWAVIGGRDALGPDSRDGAALLQRLGAMLEAGADGLRAMFNRADAASVSMLPVRSAPDLAPWPASRVTLLGDAIHAMSPAGGVGANTALDDAARLAGHLARAVQDGDLPAALAAYETDMRARANAAVAASSQGAQAGRRPVLKRRRPRPVERARRKGYPAPEPHPPAGLAPLPRKPPRPHGKPASIDETPARTDQPRRIRPAAGAILGRRGENSLRGATAVRTLRRRAAPPAGHHPLAHGRGRPRHRRPAHRWRLAARAGIGTPRLTRDIAAWNAGRSNGFLLIADDAVGGFFAINGGGLGADAGALYYWAPDTLEWEPLELSYTDFLRWALGGGLEEFYEGLRWPGWQADTQALAGTRASASIRSCGRAKARRRPARARRWIWRSCMP